MKNLALATMLLCGLPAALAAAPASQSRAEREVRAAEQQLNDALSRVDVPTVDRLWADDFQFVHPDGHVSSKAKRLAGLKPADPAAPALVSTLDDMEVRVYGQTAVVLVRTSWRGTADGKPFVSPYIATHVWVRWLKGWRLVSAQVAEVAAKN